LRELNPVVEAHHNGWECVKSFPLQTISDVVSAANKLDPVDDGEGFVVCDENYNRIKVKGLKYLAMAHMKDTFSTRRLLEVIVNCEGGEFLSAYPEYYKIYYELKSKYDRLLGEMEGYYDAISYIDNKKEFASFATKKKYSGALFNVKWGKYKSFRECLANMKIQQLEEWFDIKYMKL
jgi:hypothetical protein